MAKPNYQYEKRQRDLAKKKKQEEKRQRKLNRAATQTEAPAVPAAGEAPPGAQPPVTPEAD
ncbi:MAG: hypothetical protein OHK0026_12680 [Rhodocyclaceae bacterium]